MKMGNNKLQLAGWAERLLEWLAAKHPQEKVQGDLQELFD
jgi:hypothetical protein